MADNALPILAQSSKRADGKLDFDILARRSILDDLVDNKLSHYEIRYLRDRLCAIPLNCDILMNVPNELLLYIVSFLGLDGFLTARMVSHAWNQRLSSPEVCANIIKQHFRSTWEQSYNSVSNEAQGLATHTLSTWLSTAALKRARRQYGAYRTLHRRSYKGCETRTMSMAALSREPSYNNGKIAFRVDPKTICVQSLVNEDSARFFMDADRERIGKWFLSDRFLITQKASNKLALEAWDFELCPAGNVRLPNNILFMSAYHNKVGLVTHAKETLVWHVGGALKLLDTSDVHEKVAGFDYWLIYGVLFHPTDQDSMFVVHQAWTDARPDGDSHTYTARLIVQGFINNKPRDMYCVDTIYALEPGISLYYDRYSDCVSRISNSNHTVRDDEIYKTTIYLKLRIIVNPDGLVGMWQELCYSLTSETPHFKPVVSFSTFDMYNKKFDTGCPKPAFLEGMELITHGQAIDLYFKRSRYGSDKNTVGHPPGNLLYSSAEGDDDFVVLFGKSDYVVAIP